MGDADRASACELLTLHYSAGRLTEQELDQRIEAAVGARDSSDLQELFVDLPRLRTDPPGRVQRPANPNHAVVARVIACMVAVFTAAICLLMILGIGMEMPAMAIAALFGGTLAAIGGAALGWLCAQRGGGRHRD